MYVVDLIAKAHQEIADFSSQGPDQIARNSSRKQTFGQKFNNVIRTFTTKDELLGRGFLFSMGEVLTFS